MSYNIDSIDILASDGFCIPRPKLEALRKELGDEVPECSVVSEHFINDCEEFRGMLFPKRFEWSGEWSGNSFDVLRDRVLPAFLGSVDLAITWEGGDSHSGLRLVNGVVTEHEMTMALGKERTK